VKYLVSYKTAAFWQVEVEAETIDDAIDNADRLGPPPHLCHQESVELAGDWDIDTVEELGD
jgi:hypothetical protein